jgi:hypothetical protein
MKITLTPQESEEYFLNSLCNGLGYIESGYGLELTYDEYEFQQAKKTLNDMNESSCYEDVLMQILKDGKRLSLVDLEGDEETHSITLHDVHERVKNTPIMHLMNMINEEDDAVTADVILQTVFLNEVIYG